MKNKTRRKILLAISFFLYGHVAGLIQGYLQPLEDWIELILISVIIIVMATLILITRREFK